MLCKLSAVSVFHRISLAGMLSVSSNKDASNSTLASGATGDLRAGETDGHHGNQPEPKQTNKHKTGSSAHL